MDEIIHVIFDEKLSADVAAQSAEFKPSGCVEFKIVPKDNAAFWLQLLTKVCGITCRPFLIEYCEFQSACQPMKVLRSNVNEAKACGRVWLRQALSDDWSEGWAFVAHRQLRYWLVGLPDALFELDLRRATLLKRELSKDDWCPSAKKSSHGPLLVTINGR